MNIDFERAFLIGWQSISASEVPPQVSIDALDGCKNCSDAKFLGREYAKDYEYELAIRQDALSFQLQVSAMPALRRAEVL